MEYLLFPKKTYFLTQGFGKGTYSHVYRKAIDVSASGGGSKAVYAPFSGTIKNIYVNNPSIAYTCWIVSDNKVICADGKERYAVMMLTHPNGIKNLKIGQHFKQGQYMFDDGTTGGVAAHTDIEVAVYDNPSNIVANWYNNHNSWTLYNAVDPFKYIVMANDCKVLNDVYQGKKYTFKRVKDINVKPTPAPEYFKSGGTYRLTASKCLRRSPQIANNIVKYNQVDSFTRSLLVKNSSNAMFKVGTEITSLKVVTESNGRIWGSYGNCWYCMQNVDGTKNALKI